MNFFSKDDRSALEAKEYAQWIAFAPVIFQASRLLRDKGILSVIASSGNNGCSIEEIGNKTAAPRYGVRVLVEAGLGIGLILENQGQYTLTKTGLFILNDRLTNANLDFINDVCYEGLWFLDKSVENGKPEGLKVFGTWPTIYEGLSKLPEKVKKSWFGFDHYYSDSAFPEAQSLVFKEKPKTLLDIGGNTGKWAISCAAFDSDVRITIADLPGQTVMAGKKIRENGYEKRISLHPCNILDVRSTLPKGFEAIWMSQFLDCFSDEQIILILKKCREALNDNGYIYILETFWDRQRFRASAFSLQMTSLYFTAMANGNSQMYDSRIFLGFAEQAGLEIVLLKDEIGVSHSLLKLKKK
jgi:ubiquinone/menaquinone biosynthesis C-methylase UbiE